MDEQACELCEKHSQQSAFCEGCNAILCEKCWALQAAHRKTPRQSKGPVHEKGSYAVFKILDDILTPVRDPIQQQILHQKDSDAAWFGVGGNPAASSPGLQDFGRYQQLMQMSYTGEWEDRWPQLIAVIGHTGEGKSSIISMLIEFARRKSGMDDDKDTFPTPVVGAQGTSVPTSGDVHLYADPISFYDQRPKLIADSEGLEAGEAKPIGHKTNFKGSKALKKGRKFWDIKWANDPNTRRREFAVRHLYPRFLYTFSDVVVYVLRNERTFGATALNDLLEWAHVSIEKSVNQPTLPHAIIVVNQADLSLPDEAWDVKMATELLLNELDDALLGNPKLARFVDYLHENGKPVETTLGLKLYQEIDEACQSSHRRKRRRRVDVNADELAKTLNSGFDHFTNHLDRPFDFVEHSWTLNPVPQGFAGTILRLARVIKETCPWRQGPEIFNCMGGMVASCIMLDLARYRQKGTAEQMLTHYRPSLDQVVKDFCYRSWTCSYQLGKRSCVNTMQGHSAGHQEANGRVFGSGPYKSDFTADTYLPVWNDLLKKELEIIQQDISRVLQDNMLQENKEVAKYHLKMMNSFYRQFDDDVSKFSSHTGCFCCLRELPEHPLPCGHVLCTRCVKAFGSPSSDTSWLLEKCPLHTRNSDWFRAKIDIKPPLAGVRILCLDGGGVRGIVQLKILAAIERELGGIPIREFFDLFVGTNAGGVSVMGLGLKQWSVHETSKHMKKIYNQAFSRPQLAMLTAFHHQPKYKSRPLEHALQEVFGGQLLFGGPYQKFRSNKKVAVISTTEAGQVPVVLANYNRTQSDHITWKFERPERKDSELKQWEAARATFADPEYFKPFLKSGSTKAYSGGSPRHNCPVTVADGERKLLWPDGEEANLDLMLSIGTGVDRSYYQRQSAPGSAVEGPASPSDTKKRFRFSKLSTLFQGIRGRDHNAVDNETMWDVYRAGAHEGIRRYIRFNPVLLTLPRFDDVEKIALLEEGVNEYMARSDVTDDVSHTARCLYASCFYFEKLPSTTDKSIVKGKIRCRFEGTEHIERFADYLRRPAYGNFEPHFLISTTDRQNEVTQPRKVLFPEGFFRDLKENGHFYMPDVEINLPTENAISTIAINFDRDLGDYPISGFPRRFMVEDAKFHSIEYARHAATQQPRPQSFGSRDTTPRSSTLTDRRHSDKELVDVQDNPGPSLAASGHSYPQEFHFAYPRYPEVVDGDENGHRATSNLFELSSTSSKIYTPAPTTIADDTSESSFPRYSVSSFPVNRRSGTDPSSPAKKNGNPISTHTSDDGTPTSKIASSDGAYDRIIELDSIVVDGTEPLRSSQSHRSSAGDESPIMLPPPGPVFQVDADTASGGSPRNKTKGKERQPKHLARLQIPAHTSSRIEPLLRKAGGHNSFPTQRTQVTLGLQNAEYLVSNNYGEEPSLRPPRTGPERPLHRATMPIGPSRV